MKIYRCGLCGRPIKVGKEKFFNKIAYGHGCYRRIINSAVEYETEVLRKRDIDGKVK